MKDCNPGNILQNLTNYPGVYQMLDNNNNILYIGKAKNLKNRLQQYFNKNNLSLKNQALMQKVCLVKIVVTKTESEALLLENNLIKTHKPKYNILLKDDKNYPYIYLSNHKHPSVSLYRGNNKDNGKYFGPYPNASIVKNSLQLLKKIFKIRQCKDSFYKNRTRACLEYQINLCSAPCVGHINNSDYLNDVSMLELFLSGKEQDVLKTIANKMQQASQELNFELAVHYRNQLQQLNLIQAQTNASLTGNYDVIALVEYQGILCIQIFFIRQGKQIGDDEFYPKNIANLSVGEVLSAFLALYYLTKNTPCELIISNNIIDKNLLESNLNTKILTKVKKTKKGYLDNAILTAKIKAKQFYEKLLSANKNLINLQNILKLKAIPKHIECFDVSHMMGEATIASCVVFINGFAKKSQYRKFNITGITKGDDYGAIKQVVLRRYKRLISENKPLPDLLLIDGGVGQLSQALSVLKFLNINIPAMGVAKGNARKVGLETLIIISETNNVQKIKLKPDDSTLLLIARIRDEAHRFAIINHRKSIKKNKTTSTLEQITGIGKQKSIAILNHFGGLQGLKIASIQEITKVKGINIKLAHKIYQSFRNI